MRSPLPPSMGPFLRKLEARSSFDADERRAILELPFSAREVGPRRDFIRRGERVAHSCFVFDGIVGTFGEVRDGSRQITSVFIKGDMIDLQTLVLQEAMSAIQALTHSTVLQVKHSDLRQVTHRHPKIAEAFWRECVVDAAIINEWVVNVGRRQARARMAHVFCEMAWRFGQGRPAESYSFPVTQDQLGDMLGLTPVHVNRTLKGLREDKLLEIAGGQVHILQWDRLARTGDFDPTFLRLGTGDRDSLNGDALPTIRIVA